MLNLEQHAVSEWFSAIRSNESEWPPLERPIETAGDATALLIQLGKFLSGLRPDELERLGAVLIAPEMLTLLRSLLAQLGAARLLRMLTWVLQSGLPNASILVARLTEGPSREAQALRAALAALGRQELRERLFAIDRLSALAAATAALQEDQA